MLYRPSRITHNRPAKFLATALVCLAATLSGLALGLNSAVAAPAPVVLLTLDGTVSPATADYVVRGIQKAAEQNAGLVILRIDTPGGLDKSMRSIIKEILAAPVPVATFVAPGGARAASAGTYILYASHIAAMAPATNLGAATPVQIGIGSERGPEPKDKSAPDGKAAKSAPAKGADKEILPSKDAMTRKQVHDAAAYIRGLAQLRGRNSEWGEKAVREAVSLSAEEAKKLKVIDVIAQDVPDLLKQVNGRKVTVQGVERTLDTAGAETITLAPDWRNELLAVITDPSVALILMMIGVYGLFFEFANPGFVAPGVIGGICMLLALYALQLLPINYAGLALILLGLAFIVAEAFVPSFGALGIGGTLALIIGAVILFDPQTAANYAVPLPFIVALALTSAVIVFAMVTLAVRTHARPVVSGREEIIGAAGEMLDDLKTEGWARVHGEIWRVVGGAPLARGQKVRVTRIDGLVLSVEPDTKNN